MLARLRCLVSGGHLRVTRARPGRLQEECFVCGTTFGRGWDFRDRVKRLRRRAQKRAPLRIASRRRVA